jgi:hypothetical protein
LPKTYPAIAGRNCAIGPDVQAWPVREIMQAGEKKLVLEDFPESLEFAISVSPFLLAAKSTNDVTWDPLA